MSGSKPLRIVEGSTGSKPRRKSNVGLVIGDMRMLIVDVRISYGESMRSRRSTDRLCCSGQEILNSVFACYGSVFKDEQDRQTFLKNLGKVCQKTDWQVHAYCLTPNSGEAAIRVERLVLPRAVEYLPTDQLLCDRLSQ